MPYISSERVKKIREDIKKTFPAFKFSITTRHSSTVVINILEGPINFGASHQQVNHFYIHDRFTGEAKDMLTKIKEIANEGNRTISEDGDYGPIPAFYLRISIGQWDKPYKLLVNGSSGTPAMAIKLKKALI